MKFSLSNENKMGCWLEIDRRCYLLNSKYFGLTVQISRGAWTCGFLAVGQFAS